MHVAHERLTGLDRDRVLAVVEPVLRAHGVEGVELVWRTDRGGWLLELTIERPDSRIPGAGITIDLCSEISRDLSAALDLADVIPQRYTLEVGSPGLERALYGARDYERFAGQLAKIKLAQPLADGQRVIRGNLHGLDDAGRVVVETDHGVQSFELDAIDSARLVFDWKSQSSQNDRPKGKKNARRRAAGSQR
ncbi:MAG: ribosome maturation factor RimP [Myxococcales bacterium]|nr:ribosome maturation factor RimP [Myxococcales bacterium]MCB9576913.1 ribosome maturation factor RimP [Polyangiaceae bacterium]